MQQEVGIAVLSPLKPPAVLAPLFGLLWSQLRTLSSVLHSNLGSLKAWSLAGLTESGELPTPNFLHP